MGEMRVVNVVLTIVVIVLVGALGYLWHQQEVTRVEGVVFQVSVGTVEESLKSSIPKNTEVAILKIYSEAGRHPVNLFWVTDGKYKDPTKLLGKRIAGVMEGRRHEVATEYNDGATVLKETLLCHRLLLLESLDK